MGDDRLIGRKIHGKGNVDEGDRHIKASVPLRVRERSIMRLSSVYIKK